VLEVLSQVLSELLNVTLHCVIEYCFNVPEYLARPTTVSGGKYVVLGL
jgi:hypothetical protein